MERGSLGYVLLAEIMKNLRTISLIILLICTFKICKAEEIQEDWIKLDSIFINQLKGSFIVNPLLLEKYLDPLENSRVNLGFGYSLIEHSMGKGYVSIFYTFIYKDKKLISYVLRPQMPKNSKLTNRYLSFYEGLFGIENYSAQNLYYGYKDVSKPLGEIEKEINVSSQVAYFMTPYSGVIYGDYGGIADEILENRNAFNIVKSSITENLMIYLLKSINPATRLCATEIFYSKKESFKQKKLLKKLIEINFKELPKITTMSGCMIYVENAKTVLNQMINKNK